MSCSPASPSRSVVVVGEVDGDGRGAAGVGHAVTAGLAAEEVGAAAALEQVVAVAAEQRVAAVTAGEDVVAGVTGEAAGLVHVDGGGVVAVAEREVQRGDEPGGALRLVRGDADAGGIERGDGRAGVDEGDGPAGAGVARRAGWPRRGPRRS